MTQPPPELAAWLSLSKRPSLAQFTEWLKLREIRAKGNVDEKRYHCSWCRVVGFGAYPWESKESVLDHLKNTLPINEVGKDGGRKYCCLELPRVLEARPNGLLIVDSWDVVKPREKRDVMRNRYDLVNRYKLMMEENMEAVKRMEEIDRKGIKVTVEEVDEEVKKETAKEMEETVEKMKEMEKRMKNMGNKMKEMDIIKMTETDKKMKETVQKMKDTIREMWDTVIEMQKTVK
jgi:hypothetical protein